MKQLDDAGVNGNGTNVKYAVVCARALARCVAKEDKEFCLKIAETLERKVGTEELEDAKEMVERYEGEDLGKMFKMMAGWITHGMTWCDTSEAKEGDGLFWSRVYHVFLGDEVEEVLGVSKLMSNRSAKFRMEGDEMSDEGGFELPKFEKRHHLSGVDLGEIAEIGEALMNGFNWEGSEAGSEFYNKVHNRLRDLTKQVFEDRFEEDWREKLEGMREENGWASKWQDREANAKLFLELGALLQRFKWGDTIEGSKYWGNVWMKLKEEAEALDEKLKAG